jgi:hypothetical protein
LVTASACHHTSLSPALRSLVVRIFGFLHIIYKKKIILTKISCLSNI